MRVQPQPLISCTFAYICRYTVFQVSWVVKSVLFFFSPPVCVSSVCGPTAQPAFQTASHCSLSKTNTCIATVKAFFIWSTKTMSVGWFFYLYCCFVFSFFFSVFKINISAHNYWPSLLVFCGAFARDRKSIVCFCCDKISVKGHFSVPVSAFWPLRSCGHQVGSVDTRWTGRNSRAQVNVPLRHL